VAFTRKPREGCVPLLCTVVSPLRFSDMGQLSLPGYISSFEPPRPDNAPRNARDLRPSLSLSLSLSPNPLGSSHRRALRTSLSPPVSKTADFTSVRSAEHCRPSRHRTRNARGAPPRFGERGKVSPGAVSPFAKLAPGLAYGLPTFIPPPPHPRRPREIFIFVFRRRLDRSFRDFPGGSSIPRR